MQRIIIIYWSRCLSCSLVYSTSRAIRILWEKQQHFDLSVVRPRHQLHLTRVTHRRSTAVLNDRLLSRRLRCCRCNCRTTGELREEEKTVQCEGATEGTMHWKRWAKRWMRCDREWRQNVRSRTHNWNNELHEDVHCTTRNNLPVDLLILFSLLLCFGAAPRSSGLRSPLFACCTLWFGAFFRFLFSLSAATVVVFTLHNITLYAVITIITML